MQESCREICGLACEDDARAGKPRNALRVRRTCGEKALDIVLYAQPAVFFFSVIGKPWWQATAGQETGSTREMMQVQAGKSPFSEPFKLD